MAVITPTEVPAIVGFNSISFDISRKQQITPIQGGDMQTINRMAPIWTAKYKTPPLFGDKYNEAITWLDSLEGAMNAFLAYDPRRVMPYAYSHLSQAADPWTQTGQVAPRITASNYANSTVTLDRLQEGAVITKGDYISFYDGVTWWLYRSATTIVVGPSHSVVLSVNPRPRTTTMPQTVRYRKAICAMKIIGGYEAGATVDVPSAISFNAFQYIRRAA